MRYAILDVDVAEPLPEVVLAEDERGIALLLRRKDRPIQFSFHEIGQGAQLSPDELGQLIAETAGIALLE